MSKIVRLLSGRLMICVAMVACAISLHGRTWTLASGDKLEGDLISYKNRNVVIAKSGGGRALYSIDKLSAPDQAFVRQAFPEGDRKDSPPPKSPAAPKPATTAVPPANAATPPPQEFSEPQPEAMLPQPGNFRIGTAAPPETGGTLRDGSTVTLSQLRGKLVIIEFVSFNSSIYQQEISSLIAVYNYGKPKGLEIISIFKDKNRDGLIHFRDKNHMDWPTMQDNFGRVFEKWGISGLPTRVLVDQNGIIVADQVSVNNLPSYLDKYMGRK